MKINFKITTLTAAALMALSAPLFAAITAEQAKEAALKHAGVTSQQAVFTEVKFDREIIGSHYDIEFFVGNVKYEYDIDPDGNVKDISQEMKGRGPAPKTSAELIGEAKAAEIALSRVPGASKSNLVKMKLDYDDGVQVYEGEIRYNRKEYEFEIDARTGAVRQWEMDD